MRTRRFIVVIGLAASFLLGFERAPREVAAESGNPKRESAPKEQAAEGQPPRTPNVSLKSQPGEYMELATPIREPRELQLISVAVDAGPVIDGIADDGAWQSASEVTTLDRSCQKEIRIKSVHTADEIFMLVSYPDAAPSESHKTWIWDAGEGIYKQGSDREDCFLFRWSMSGNDANLSLFRDPRPHKSDIWFWKACRSNPAGYADDKLDVLDSVFDKRNRRIELSNVGALYLSRSGDAGEAAYDEKMVFEYEGDTVRRFTPRQPEGSRADVRAKGRWSDGQWTIEFARKLDTGHDDDVTFALGGSYLFGVSRYEISYDLPDPEFTQPLYRTGDVFDRLLLTIGR